MANVPTVLVSGASGYIATHIIQQLQQDGHYKIRGTVRSTKNEQKVAPLKNLCPGAKYPVELVEADLMDEKPWVNAVKGCEYVLHTASPFVVEAPKHDDELIKPAVNGTLNVLKACRAAGGVKRVILTSSAAAIERSKDKGILNENNWTDTTDMRVSAYYKSKTLAERAAWDYMKDLPQHEKFELVVLNPVGVFGPPLSGGISASQEIPKQLLQHEMPMLPNLNFCVVDVRDVARAHINALSIPEAAGKRHVLMESNAWLVDIAKVLSDEFKPQGYNVPLKVSPNILVKFAGLFDRTAKQLSPLLGQEFRVKSDKIKTVLGITNPISMKKSLFDMTYSMIESGKIKKTPGYKGPQSTNM